MKYFKYLLLIAILVTPVVAFAGFDDFQFGTGWGLPSGEGAESPVGIAVSVVNIVLSFLGIITLIIVLWGGFLYLFARGNTEQAGKGKKVLLIGVLGIGIVLAAYGISYFVFDQLSAATGGEGSGYVPGGEEGFQCRQAGGICKTCAQAFNLGAYDCPEFTVCCRDSTTGCDAPERHCEWDTGEPNCDTGAPDGKRDCGMGRKCCKD